MSSRPGKPPRKQLAGPFYFAARISMEDIDEVWTVLCQTIVADADTLALLGSAQSVVYSEDSLSKLPAYPFVRLMLLSGLPERFDSDAGRFDLELQIDVFSNSKATNYRVLGKIAGLLHVPVKRPAGFDTDHYEVREMTPGIITPVGEIGLKDSEQKSIHQTAQNWTLRVVKTD